MDIPEGMEIAKLKDGIEDTEVDNATRWRTIKDLSNKRFYYQTQNDPALHLIDLNKINF